MLSLNFNTLQYSKNFSTAVKNYCNILNCINPKCLVFQERFAGYYGLNRSDWKSPIMRPLFFNIFDAFYELSYGTTITYEMIITILSKISGSTEKSFVSKILHTLYKCKPIIDRNALDKLRLPNSDFEKLTGFKLKGENGKYTIKEAVALYNAIERYYIYLSRDLTTLKYIKDFDSWCWHKNINPKSISDTKKIDFRMWLA